MENQITKTIPKTGIATLQTPLNQQEPEQVLAFAKKAAQALMQVVNSQSKQFTIRGERYLDFQSWQTLARFYNVTVGIEWVKSEANEKKVFGYSARAVVYQSGNIISSAEASCFRDEPNWKSKPSHQLKSMAQTRSCAKALRNVLSWVSVLGGFKPTPAEEVINVSKESNSIPVSCEPYNEEPIGMAEEYTEQDAIADRAEEEKNEEEKGKITEKQEKFLKELIIEKVEDEDDRESQLSNLSLMPKWEASELISELLEQPKAMAY